MAGVGKLKLKLAVDLEVVTMTTIKVLNCVKIKVKTTAHKSIVAEMHKENLILSSEQ